MSADEPSAPNPATPQPENRGPGFTEWSPVSGAHGGTPLAGQPYTASPGDGQSSPNQPYTGPGPQSFSGQPYPTQPYTGQPYAGQPYTGQPYTGQPYAGQPYTGQGPLPHAGQPYAGQTWAGPGPQPYGGQPPAYPAPQAAQQTPAGPTGGRTERVARGILFSLGGIVVGIVLTLVLWKLNFIASITSFAMAYATVWLYVKGAGTAPRKGVGGVIAVIVVGVVASLASIVAADGLDYLASEYPDASLLEKIEFVAHNLVRPQVWQNYTTNVVMYIVFAALGTFGLIRQLGRSRGAR